MKIKKFAYFIIFLAGIIYIIRFFYRKIFNNPIKILYTHRIIDKTEELFLFFRKLDYFTTEEFEKKIKYLIKHYKFISLQEATEYLKLKKKPANRIVLTFDDGYKCIYTKAFPILKKYKVPATIFLTVGSVANRETQWHDKLTLLIGKTKVTEFYIPELSNRLYKVRTLDEREQSYKDINNCLKRIENSNKEEILEKMFDYLKLDRLDLSNNNLMLSWEEINEMHRSGLISFGSHTMSHPILTRIPLGKAEYEIQESKRIIADNLGAPVKLFSYPNGDYNEDIKNLVKNNGYLCACATGNNSDNGKIDLFALNRDGFISEDFYIFGLKMAGLFNLIKQIKNNYHEFKS